MGSSEATAMSFPVLLKNMILLILTFGIGFTVGSFATSRVIQAEFVDLEIQGMELDLEEWR